MSTPIGLNISDYSIEAMQLDKNKRVLAYGRILMEEGIVDNGEIKNEEKLAAKIKKLLASTRPRSIAPRRYPIKAVVSVPESQTFINTFDIQAKIPSAKIATLVRQEVANLIPYLTENLYQDFLELIPQKAVLSVSAPKPIVDSYIKTLNAAGVQPVAFEPESVSLGRSLLLDNYPHHAAILDIGARTSIFSIFDEEKRLLYSLTIPVAGNHFTKEIANYLKITPNQAEIIKRQFGFLTKNDNQVLSILQKSFVPIINECKKAIEYHENKTAEKISSIILTGGSSFIPAVDQYISLNLDKPVKIGSSPFFAAVIGLALRASNSHPEADINLISKKHHFHPPLIIGKPVVSLAAVILLLIGASGYLLINRNLNVLLKAASPPLINIHKLPVEKSSLVSQISLNENYEILEKYQDWVKIKLIVENKTIIGWIKK